MLGSSYTHTRLHKAHFEVGGINVELCITFQRNMPAGAVYYNNNNMYVFLPAYREYCFDAVGGFTRGMNIIGSHHLPIIELTFLILLTDTFLYYKQRLLRFEFE